MATCDSSGEKNRPPAYQQAKIINALAEKGTVSMRHTSVHFRVKLCSMRLLSMRSNEGSQSEPWGEINVFCCSEDFLSIFFNQHNSTLSRQKRHVGFPVQPVQLITCDNNCFCFFNHL